MSGVLYFHQVDCYCNDLVAWIVFTDVPIDRQSGNWALIL